MKKHLTDRPNSIRQLQFWVLTKSILGEKFELKNNQKTFLTNEIK
jgi:hypothetical protein